MPLDKADFWGWCQVGLNIGIFGGENAHPLHAQKRLAESVTLCYFPYILPGYWNNVDA